MSKRTFSHDNNEATNICEKRTKLGSNDSIISEAGVGELQTNFDFTVGWICAISTEYVAANAFLDEKYSILEYTLPNDNNDYTLGRIGKHNVVIAVLPDYGIASAAAVARDMMRSFPNINIRLMVGIGGGAPTPKHDIRLGDVVVSVPRDAKSGVLQYDFGKTIQNQEFQMTGFLNQPPRVLMAAIAGLRTRYDSEGHQFEETIQRILDGTPRLQRKFQRPDQITDRLYKSDVIHPPYDDTNCAVVCGDATSNLVLRAERPQEDTITIHYGLVASANRLMKDAVIRDKLALENEVLCFEMEAAGLMNDFSCLVIRGICDYSDSHKNKDWQGYAAMVAAAYARDLIYRIRPSLAEAPGSMVVVPIDSKSAEDQSLHTEQIETLLKSLRFEQIGARHMTIKNAHAKTCKWLLSNHQYLDWLDPGKLDLHHGFLWIKGKPGTGKSTLMKFILTNAQKRMKDKLIISFYFNARGGDMEKCTTGMYRSLLLQLFEHLPELRHILHCLPNAGIGEEYSWGIESLKFIFGEAIRSIKETRVICFIDALDECDEDEIRDMVSFFQNIRAEVRQKAAGIFMWVYLVVEILNKEFDRGRIHVLRQRLKDIPGDLHELFRDILTRDHHNRDELLLCIQWLLFSRQPLSVEELYFAVLSGTFPESIDSWDANEISIEDMKKFILSCSKGLTEITKSKRATVQFIHESVKDFLFKDGLKDISTSLGAKFEGGSHERLKQCCLEYLNKKILIKLEVPKMLPKASSPDAGSLRQLVRNKFPFINYAVQNIFYHANAAEMDPNAQSGFFHIFPFAEWVKLSNLLEKFENRRYTSDVTVLYVLAKHNAGNLIRYHPLKLTCFEVEGERYGPPLFAALATNSNEAVEVFLQAHAHVCDNRTTLLSRLHEKQSQNKHNRGRMTPDFTFSARRDILSYLAEYGEHTIASVWLNLANIDVNSMGVRGRTPLLRAAENGHEAIVRLLLKHGADIEAKDSVNGTALNIAASHGYDAVIMPLLESGADTEARVKGNTSLHKAVSGGYEAIVRLLLDAGANFESQAFKGETPLSIAAFKGHESIFRLLIESGADIKSKDFQRKTALHRAASMGHEAIVMLLIEAGAGIEDKDSAGLTPLCIVASKGHENIAKLLLRHGADIKVKNENGNTPLHEAVFGGFETTIRLLLDAGADVESKDLEGKTPLAVAASMGHGAVVKMLLEVGADTKAKDRYNGLPLHKAVYGGHESIVRVLLESGMDVNKLAISNRKLIFLAVASVRRTHKAAIIKLLLQVGADVNGRDKRDRTPLYTAAGFSHEDVIKLLLESGADVKATTKDNETPLHRAVTRGHENITKLLLESGADIDAKDKDNETPLHRAAIHGHESVIKILLERGADIEAKDKCGETLLHKVAKYGQAETIKLLIAHNAKFQSRDSSNQTPLEIARRRLAITRPYEPKGKIRNLIQVLELASREAE
ncbi:pfs, nb-arc and ankyrin domain [Trichoderma arundinaceum]|uniref:Pfs, nb-arc and ankyrin domain n=1 Tax=Trichoderma arundinaceum TaxID=490622 RepID=A0A395NXB5_TRIAR|nr:pfs, nb-arc and ankyrin domain [Trichoderma arundinaceum]